MKELENNGPKEEKNLQAQCKKSNGALRKVWIGLQGRAQVVGRHLKASGRAAKLEAHIFKRLNQEAANYQEFVGMIVENDKSWESFVNHFRNAGKKVFTFLGKVHSKILELAASEASQGAFVQMEKPYYSELAEIKAEFDNMSEDDFQGTHAAVNNLLEIMANEKAVADPKVRLAVNEVCHEIHESIREALNKLEAENATQSVLNDGLKELFESNKQRCERMRDAAEETGKHISAKAVIYQKLFDSAQDFVERSRKCLRRSMRICQEWNELHRQASIRNHRLLNYVEQIREIAQERFPTLTSYFIQRSGSN